MKHCAIIALFAVLTFFSTGCGLLLLGTVVTAAAVTGTGYVVYKTGEKVVVTTGKAAVGIYKVGEKVAVTSGNAAGSAMGGVQEIVFFNNELKATCPADVRKTHQVASESLTSLGFTNINGRTDAAAGRLEAMTSENHKIEITLKHKNTQQTSIQIKVGVRGNMKTSELIFDHIIARL